MTLYIMFLNIQCGSISQYVHINFNVQVCVSLIIVRMEEHVLLPWMPKFSASEETYSFVYWRTMNMPFCLYYRCLQTTYGDQCQFINNFEGMQHIVIVKELQA